VGFTLSYLHSCIRETITGGVVTVGIDQSEVQAGKVTRTKLDCGESMFVLTGNTDAQFAGRVLRGAKPHSPWVLVALKLVLMKGLETIRYRGKRKV
jgi:hypothetical protein